MYISYFSLHNNHYNLDQLIYNFLLSIQFCLRLTRDTNQYIAEQYIVAIYWYCQYQYQYWLFENCNINIEFLQAIFIALVQQKFWRFFALRCDIFHIAKKCWKKSETLLRYWQYIAQYNLLLDQYQYWNQIDLYPCTWRVGYRTVPRFSGTFFFCCFRALVITWDLFWVDTKSIFHVFKMLVYVQFGMF